MSDRLPVVVCVFTFDGCITAVNSNEVDDNSVW